ncbi:MAG: InlB B-repeat-containing protein [Clostridiaceae bacterium]|nr:InlB B-repeat-containing protein [Clostridiaceae bacterium]
MIKQKIKGRFLFAILLTVSGLLLASCTRMGHAIDPGDWGFESCVIYDAMGGSINTREKRETYYLPNSYLFEPAGTTNMLIKPVRDGYILAGWYTAKSDIVDEKGQIVGYDFRAEDRWDFVQDRVQGDMTLYARWIPHARVDYVDAASKTVLFSKNVTTRSTIQPLSPAAEQLVTPGGQSLYGYFADESCTTPYAFDDYQHAELIPDHGDIFSRLQKEFPEYIETIDFVPPEESSEDNPVERNPDLYMNELGYAYTTSDPEVRAMIRSRTDQIIEDSINHYVENSTERVVYLKFIEGNYLRVCDVEDLRQGNSYGFSGQTAAGRQLDGYIIESDLDFAGKTIFPAEQFSGRILGNGHKLSNINIGLSSRKIDPDTSKQTALFLSLESAQLENLIFENISLTINVNSGIRVTAAVLAVKAANTTMQNVTFDGITINTGRGDDGQARYEIYDLFPTRSDNQLIDVTGSRVKITASDTARITHYFPVEAPPVAEMPASTDQP